MFRSFFRDLSEAEKHQVARNEKKAAVTEALKEIKSTLNAQTAGKEFVPNAELGWSLAKGVKDILLERVPGIRIRIQEDTLPTRCGFNHIGLFPEENLGFDQLKLYFDFLEKPDSSLLTVVIRIHRG